jgi:hypothetical protein
MARYFVLRRLSSPVYRVQSVGRSVCPQRLTGSVDKNNGSLFFTPTIVQSVGRNVIRFCHGSVDKNNGSLFFTPTIVQSVGRNVIRFCHGSVDKNNGSLFFTPTIVQSVGRSVTKSSLET